MKTFVYWTAERSISRPQKQRQQRQQREEAAAAAAAEKRDSNGQTLTIMVSTANDGTDEDGLMTTTISKSIRYRGEVKNTVRHGGNGNYRYELGGSGMFSYDGPWQDGRKHGSGGKFTLKGMCQYTGDFQHGEMTGMGVKTFVSGARYSGEFVQGEMCGAGTWESGDGDEVYVGSFLDNKRNGEGTVTWRKNGSSMFHGSFSNHMRHGNGTYLMKNTLFLEAHFAHNLMQGLAKIQWQRTASFDGMFASGWMDGDGQYITFDRSYQYVGQFSAGRPLLETEAAYLFTQLDRSAVIVKPAAEVVGGKGAPAKAAAPPAKGKGPVSEVR